MPRKLIMPGRGADRVRPSRASEAATESPACRAGDTSGSSACAGGADEATSASACGARLCISWVARSVTVVIRSEEHTSELQSLMRISYAVFCLKKKTKQNSMCYTQITQNTADNEM